MPRNRSSWSAGTTDRAANGRLERHRTIIVRPFSVIASLTMPTDRPATSTIPGVALAYPRRINAPSNAIVKPLAFISASEQPFGLPASISSALIWSPVRPCAVIYDALILFRADNVAFPTGRERRSRRGGHCPNRAKCSRARIIAGLSGFLTVWGTGRRGSQNPSLFRA
jgi:hypothetical protein